MSDRPETRLMPQLASLARGALAAGAALVAAAALVMVAGGVSMAIVVHGLTAATPGCGLGSDWASAATSSLAMFVGLGLSPMLIGCGVWHARELQRRLQRVRPRRRAAFVWRRDTFLLLTTVFAYLLAQGIGDLQRLVDCAGGAGAIGARAPLAPGLMGSVARPWLALLASGAIGWCSLLSAVLVTIAVAGGVVAARLAADAFPCEATSSRLKLRSGGCRDVASQADSGRRDG